MCMRVMCVYIYLSVCVCVCASLCVCVCVCACVCVKYVYYNLPVGASDLSVEAVFDHQIIKLIKPIFIKLKMDDLSMEQ